MVIVAVVALTEEAALAELEQSAKMTGTLGLRIVKSDLEKKLALNQGSSVQLGNIRLKLHVLETNEKYLISIAEKYTPIEDKKEEVDGHSGS